jgi:hypothetical protein
LEELGFRVPPTGGRRLFDIVIPAVLFVAVITMLFWLSVDAISRMMGARAPALHMSVVYGLTSAVAASLMYGYAAFIALNRRSAQIEERVWRQGSPRCLVAIAIHAGLVTWAVIIVSTVLWQLPATFQSLAGLASLAGLESAAKSLEQIAKLVSSPDAAAGPGAARWSFLPVRMATALPWLLAGATASVLLASLMGGDVRRAGKPARARDAVTVGLGLGLAAALAQLIQISLNFVLAGEITPLRLVPIVGLAGLACGAVLGLLVPQACRANLVTPPDRTMAGVLGNLLRQAETILGSRVAAKDWVFMPRNELGGITPAEAIQYKTHATGVRRILESEAQQEETGPHRTSRPVRAVVA